MRAWASGEIQRWLDKGYGLREAQSKAWLDGKCLSEDIVSNLVVNVGKYLVGDLMIDVEGSGLGYHEIGTGTNTPAVGDVALQTPSGRKIWTTRSRTGNVIDLSVFYTSSECGYDIKECGVWGGDGATATIGTGSLFSRYLQSYDNTSGAVDLTFDYSLAIG